MKTKWILNTLMTLTLAVAFFGVTGCNKSEPATSDNKTEATASDKVAVKYTCTMHPEVVADAPGTCPKCSMKLVEKR